MTRYGCDRLLCLPHRKALTAPSKSKMTSCILNPQTLGEILLSLRLQNQGADAFYLAELRLQEKMLPAKIKIVTASDLKEAE